MTSRFYVGADIGQMRDFTAVAVVERSVEWKADTQAAINYPAPQPITKYHLRDLTRVRGLKYTEVVDILRDYMEHQELVHEAELLVDVTGVGRGVYDLMVSAGLSPVAITIHGGWNVKMHEEEDGTGYAVPKQDLVAALQLLFQQDRILFSPAIDDELLTEFSEELQNFRVKTTNTGRLQFEAEGADEHDDLVIAASLAAWYGQLDEDRDKRLAMVKRPKVGERPDPFARRRKKRVPNRA